jgi:hypothetical protein
MWTGERQSTRMRICYLDAALWQDVSFFDTDVRASDVIYAINADAVVVQDTCSGTADTSSAATTPTEGSPSPPCSPS